MGAFFWRFVPEARDPVGLAHDSHQHDAVVLPMEQDGASFSFIQVDSAVGLRVSNMLKYHGVHEKVREKNEGDRIRPLSRRGLITPARQRRFCHPFIPVALNLRHRRTTRAAA